MQLYVLSSVALFTVLPLIQAQDTLHQLCDASTFLYQRNYTGNFPFKYTLHGWLSGECTSAAGLLTNSTLDLSQCLGNDNGDLRWKADGAYVNSCVCDITAFPQLCCTCEMNNSGKKPNACVNLGM
ncbi:CVNH domain-containing protein [Phlyctema vagabunda]|uniref:CVNH domain-containing protein n=1 Tax=Phlyctema vagabunda TaxID=108571 RepID=A0ABR4P2K8_9HELO